MWMPIVQAVDWLDRPLNDYPVDLMSFSRPIKSSKEQYCYICSGYSAMETVMASGIRGHRWAL